MQTPLLPSKTSKTVSTQDSSRKSSANSWLEAFHGPESANSKSGQLRFHTKSGKKYSSRVAYFSVMLKGDTKKFTNLVFGTQKDKESRRLALTESKFSKAEYLQDIIEFCASED